MKEKLEKIRELGLEKIDATKTIQELEDVRKDLMGKKSELADVMKNMGSLALEDKKSVGMMTTEIKNVFQEKLASKEEEIILCSGKTGVGVDKLLDAIVERIPAPVTDNSKKTRALIFDSAFDAYRGVVVHVRVVDGTLKVKDKIKMMASSHTYEIVELGVNNPKEVKKDMLVSGEVGWIVAAIKDISTVEVGDTITLEDIIDFHFKFERIHPFGDGNGRMSRLLTLLLLYKAGYLVGKYISIEMVVEKSKETYYEVLQDSSINWHENTNDYMPFIRYTLGTIINAYKDFEDRFILLEKKKIFKKYIPAYSRMIKVKKWLEKHETEYDFIVYEDGLTYMLPFLFKKISRKKIVSHLHWVGDPDKKSSQYISTLIPVSEFVGKEWNRKCHNSDIDIKVVKNGIQIDRFSKTISDEEKNAIKEELKIKKDAFVVLYVGRIVPEKGISELIQAINLIENENLVLIMAGASKFALDSMTPYENKIKSLIEKCNHQIIQLGYIKNNELYKYQNISNIAVIPTVIEEAAPLACVENMAAGLPIIITNSGGMPEYSGDKCSIIVEKEKNLPSSLAKEIVKLMDDEQLRNRMSAYAKEEARAYSIENMYNSFFEVLDSLHSGR